LYKCYHCNANFDRKDNTELKQDLCPGCGSTDYVDAFKCEICGRYHFPSEIYKGICYECAEKEYTDRRGLEFIDKHKDFYLDHRGIFGIEKEEKDGVIEDLREKFLERIDMDDDQNHQLEHLKNYILEDMDVWIEFLREEI